MSMIHKQNANKTSRYKVRRKVDGFVISIKENKENISNWQRLYALREAVSIGSPSHILNR